MIRGFRLPNWDDLRLKNKLILLYLAAVLIPILLTNLFFYQMTADNVRSDKVKDLRQSLERNKDNFRKMIDNIVSFSSVIYNDGPLYSALDEDYSGEEQILYAFSEVFNNSINRFVPLNKQFYNAYLYTDNPTLIHAGMIRLIDDETESSDWYRETSTASGSRKWLVYTNSSSCEQNEYRIATTDCDALYLSVIRDLDFYKGYSHYRKILKVDIQPQYMKSTLFDNSFPGEIYLVNPAGEVVYSSQIDSTYRPDDPPPSGMTLITSSIDDIEYLKGWKVAGLYKKEVIDRSLLGSRTFIVVLTCANLLFPGFILLLFSRSLIARLGMLLGGMKGVKNQRFDQLQVRPAQDEIGQLTKEFNTMSARINELIQDVYIAELDRRQAQFNALQSQINPHYLYNTLEAIRMNCLIKNEDETASMIKLLGRGFRRSLSWDQDRIPFAEEMEFVQDYLDIQQFRFGNHLSYQLEVDDRTYDIRIPKMTILSLVENACVHGIEHLEYPGRIEVTAKLVKERVHIRVADNGVGMDRDRLVELLTNIRRDHLTPQDRHIGIKNGYDRLKWHFDGAFEFNIDSEPGLGTIIRIDIPAQYGDE